METVICPIHEKEMKHSAKGFYCPTPIEKTPDGKEVLKWCTYKPTDTPVTEKPNPNYTPAIQKKVEEIREKLNPEIQTAVDWDAKDRQSMAQTAMKSASEVVSAMLSTKYIIEPDEIEKFVKDMANEFYLELKKMKEAK